MPLSLLGSSCFPARLSGFAKLEKEEEFGFELEFELELELEYLHSWFVGNIVWNVMFRWVLTCFLKAVLEPTRVCWDDRAVTHKCKRSWRLEGTGAALDLWVQKRVPGFPTW